MEEVVNKYTFAPQTVQVRIFLSHNEVDGTPCEFVYTMQFIYYFFFLYLHVSVTLACYEIHFITIK